VRLGLFQPAAAAAGGAGANGDGAAPEPLRLAWYSTLSEIVERAGPGALEEAACPVCGGDGRKRLLEKQGFTLVRCLDCFHAYVNPRLAGAVRARLGAELDGHGEDVFLEVQRIYAEPLCRRFLAAAAGRRLLDVGFGRGHLLHAARAYGFEVFGVDGSPALVEAQRPYLGERVVCQTVGEEPLPWGAFDVVVLSHVLEHLPRPQSLLGRVREALNPEGLLYVAVPDLGSVQFRVLGRRWNVVNPLVHFQYFNQASLERLLADAGMEVVERVEHPALNEAVAPRWMRLFRRLGGSESGELALLARVRP
jgi:SAM-dependent methyltransferase